MNAVATKWKVFFSLCVIIVTGFSMGLLIVPMTFKEQIVLRNNKVARRYYVCFTNFKTYVLGNTNALVDGNSSEKTDFLTGPRSNEIAMTISFNGQAKPGPAYDKLMEWAHIFDSPMSDHE